MRRIALPGLVGMFALLNAAWMPTADWQPVPDPVMAEINTFFTSMEQDRLNYDVTSVLAHYTPDITIQLQGPDGAFLRTYDEPMIRDGLTTPIAHDREQHTDSSAPHRRQDFQYQAGPDDQQFAIRYKDYLLRPNGTVEPQPFRDVTCVFKRGPMGLRIAQEINRVLGMAVHPITISPATTSTIPPTDK